MSKKYMRNRQILRNSLVDLNSILSLLSPLSSNLDDDEDIYMHTNANK